MEEYRCGTVPRTKYHIYLLLHVLIEVVRIRVFFYIFTIYEKHNTKITTVTFNIYNYEFIIVYTVYSNKKLGTRLVQVNDILHCDYY